MNAEPGATAGCANGRGGPAATRRRFHAWGFARWAVRFAAASVWFAAGASGAASGSATAVVPAPGAAVVHAPAATREKSALPAAHDAASKLFVSPAPAWVRPFEFDPAPSRPEVIQGHPTEFLLIDFQARGCDAPEYFTQVATRILTTEGVDELGEISVDFDPSYQALHWHKLEVVRAGRVESQLDATKIRLLQRETSAEAKMFDGSVSAVAVLEDLRPGDVVVYAYTIVGENPIFGGKLSVSYYPAMARPVRRYEVRVLDRTDRRFVVRTRATQVEPLVAGQPRPRAAEVAVTDGAAGREYTWSGRDLEPVETEGEAPGWFEPWPRIELSQYADWAAVVAWALELYEPPLAEALPGELAVRVVAWEKEFGKTDRRAEAAVRFVQDEIRYLGFEAGENSHKPHAPAEVFARRFGDCKDKTTLTIALLRRLGVKAWPALIASSGGPEVPHGAPSPYAFDHVIVAYEFGGVLRFVDPTHQQQGGRLIDSVVPPYDWTLLVRAGETALRELPRRRHDEPLRAVKERFVFDRARDEARLEVTTTMLGPAADEMRVALARTPRQRLAMQYLNFYAREFPGIELAAEPTWTDDRAANRLVISETYVVHEPCETDAESRKRSLTVRAREIGELVEKPTTLRRRTPLGLSWPVHVRQTIEVVLPGGWEIETQRTQKETEHFGFRSRVAAKGDVLTLDYTYRTKTDVVAPGAMRAHVKALDEIGDALAFTAELPALALPKPKARTR